jgi:hypothetical protein
MERTRAEHVRWCKERAHRGETACDECKAAHSTATSTRQRSRFLAC